MSPKRNPLARVTVMVKRKAGMSFEEFDKYWTQSHGPMLSSLPIVKEKLVRYTQVHLDMPKMLEVSGKGFPIYNDFDGLVEAYAETWDDLMSVFESDDYKNIVYPDEGKFIQRDECKMFFSYEETHWDRDDQSSSSSAYGSRSTL